MLYLCYVLAYNYGGHETGSLEELAMYYNYGKQESEAHASKCK